MVKDIPDILTTPINVDGEESTLLKELLELGLEAWEYQDDTHHFNVVIGAIEAGLFKGEIEYDEDGDVEDFDWDFYKNDSLLREAVKSV